jgi:hypothetical protein
MKEKERAKISSLFPLKGKRKERFKFFFSGRVFLPTLTCPKAVVERHGRPKSTVSWSLFWLFFHHHHLLLRRHSLPLPPRSSRWSVVVLKRERERRKRLDEYINTKHTKGRERMRKRAKKCPRSPKRGGIPPKGHFFCRESKIAKKMHSLPPSNLLPFFFIRRSKRV